MVKMLLRGLVGVGVFGAVAYLGACVFLFLRQAHFVFFPSAVIQSTPKLLHLNYQEVWLPIQTPSGVERMHGWWIPASKPVAVMLYLHGNASNIGANAVQAARFQQMGFSVLLIDYRGYGRSEGGFPTEARVYQDASIAWNYLVGQQQIPPNKIFIYGHSLGGAIAINLVVQHPNAAGLIVESSFTSMQQMVDYRGIFWMFPTNLILTQQFNSLAKIGSLQVPILLIHGTADRIVPASMSQQLFAAAPEPKQLVLIPNAGHNNVSEIGGSQYLQAVQKFVQQVQTRVVEF